MCQVDLGRETVQIVTGAGNVKAKHRIPVALLERNFPENEIEEGKAQGLGSLG